MASDGLAEENLLGFVHSAEIRGDWVAADGTIRGANAPDHEPLRYSADEYIGHNITEFHADAEVIGDILRRLSSGERLRDYGSRLRCKDLRVRRSTSREGFLSEAE